MREFVSHLKISHCSEKGVKLNFHSGDYRWNQRDGASQETERGVGTAHDLSCFPVKRFTWARTGFEP